MDHFHGGFLLKFSTPEGKESRPNFMLNLTPKISHHGVFPQLTIMEVSPFSALIIVPLTKELKPFLCQPKMLPLLPTPRAARAFRSVFHGGACTHVLVSTTAAGCQ
ncbi:unnamed protein product [Citrullus colocynthis]|uniref:Uncharacterized protein n=1 Tax=Citrullus colocynthis TaxID=252529 RepID=A0ABP0YAX3_9ROSI